MRHRGNKYRKTGSTIMKISKFLIIAPTEKEWWYALGSYWNMEIPSAHNRDRDPCSFCEFDRARSWHEAFQYVVRYEKTAFIGNSDIRLRQEWVWINLRRQIAPNNEDALVVGGNYDSVSAMIVSPSGAHFMLDRKVCPPDISAIRHNDRINLLHLCFVEPHIFTEPKLC